MGKQTTNIKEFPKYDESPFEINLVEKRIPISSDWKELGEDEQGLVIQTRTIVKHVSKLVEENSFTKVYNLTADILPLLRTPGIQLFSYMIKHLQYGKDTIMLYRTAFVIKDKTQGSTSVTFTRGISELLQHGVIARTKYPNLYFVNTNVLFNGSKRKLNQNGI